MKIPTLAETLRRPLFCVALGIAFTATQGRAQSTPSGSATDTAPAGTTTAAAPAEAPTDETIVELDPFVVSGSEDEGYRATATLAGTRIRTELKDVGASVSVVTQKFLSDTNSKSADQLLVYTTNTEVAGQGGNFLGQGDGALVTNSNSLLNRSNVNTRVRGLAEADTTRDFFLSDIPWDSYNVGRVDLQRGANSVLFGIGSPAGIINASTNGAVFKNSAKLENQLGSFGTVRFTADVNRVLIENELAVRLDLLRDRTKYRQDPAFKDDDRYYVAAKWDPSFLNYKDSSIHTSIRGNFEKGRVKANDPFSTPPLDAITPWFSKLFKSGFNYLNVQNEINTLPADVRSYIGAAGGRIFDGVATVFNGSAPGITFPTGLKNYPDKTNTINPIPSVLTNGTGYRGIVTANQLSGPFADIGAYKAISLQDRSVYDFFNNQLAGPNQGRFNNFKAYDVALSQTFLNDKVGYELAYDWQKVNYGYNSFLATDANAITVDVMRSFVDGSLNPNFGRPMVIAGGGSAQGGRTERTRKDYRLTVYGNLDFKEISGKDSTMARIFGSHTFTGLYAKDKQNFSTATYKSAYLDSSFTPATFNTGDGSSVQVSQAARDNIMLVYLGTSLVDPRFTSASGLHLQGVKDVINPPAISSINYWNNIDGRFEVLPIQTVNNNLLPDDQKTYTAGDKSRTTIDSKAIIWQGHMFDDIVVPMIGIRKDSSDFFGAGNAPDLAGAGNGGLKDLNNPAWQIPKDPSASVSGTSRTYSVVVHTPRQLREKLPGNMDISPFYNQSENFQPDASRKDLFGDPIGNPSGKTKEYGVAFSFLDDKLTLKIAKYKTSVTAASLGDFGWQSYLIGAVEAWGNNSAFSFRKVRDTGVLDSGNRAWQSFGTTSDGHILTWRPGPARALDGSNDDAYNANIARDPETNPYSQAEIDQTWLVENASINAWFENLVPAKFQSAWGLTDYATGGTSWGGASGITVTGDTISKGTEFELAFQPIRGLDISVNASKTSAQRTNLAQTYVDWIQGRWDVFQGPVGDMRLWSQDPEINQLFGSRETVRGKYGRETMAAYFLWQALQNSDVPELRPWRFNLVANYSFSEGRLSGANIGGSYRWANASVTGFPVLTDVDGIHRYDVTKPYKGKGETALDLWVGYNWKISDKYRVRTQINVRNVFASNTLLPVTVQPDGSAAAFRIPEPRTWSLTNTLEF